MSLFEAHVQLHHMTRRSVLLSVFTVRCFTRVLVNHGMLTSTNSRFQRREITDSRM